MERCSNSDISVSNLLLIAQFWPLEPIFFSHFHSLKEWIQQIYTPGGHCIFQLDMQQNSFLGGICTHADRKLLYICFSENVISRDEHF